MTTQLSELVWPGWTDRLDLNLMIGSTAREARIEEAAAAAASRRDVSSSSSSSSTTSSSYVPPPLRLPAHPFTCFALDGHLTVEHLQLLAESLAIAQGLCSNSLTRDFVLCVNVWL